MNCYVYADNSYKVPITGLYETDIKVEHPSKIINTPIETGVMSIDNKVIDPVKITVTGSCAVMSQVKADGAPTNTLSILKYMWKNKNFNFYSISTFREAYKNLILKDLITVNSTDAIDLTKCTLVFVEALLIQSDKSKTPANKENSSMNDNGVLTGK